MQIMKYREYFSLKQFLFVDFNKMLHDSEIVLTNIFDFIGVNPEIVLPRLPVKNASKQFLRINALGHYLRKTIGTRITDRLLPRQLTRSRIESNFTNIDEKTRSRICELLHNDVNNLRRLTLLSFDEWTFKLRFINTALSQTSSKQLYVTLRIGSNCYGLSVRLFFFWNRRKQMIYWERIFLFMRE